MKKFAQKFKFLIVLVAVSFLGVAVLWKSKAEGEIWGTNFVIFDNENFSFNGESGTDTFGEIGTIRGDLNGDGVEDLLVGAHKSDTNVGEIYIVFGGSESRTRNMSIASTADASYEAEAVGNYPRATIVGDVNGDNIDDFLVGAYGNDETGTWAGQAYLVFGKNSGWDMNLSLADADASFLGENADDRFGHAIAGGCDVNNDGFDDFIIGAYANDDGGDSSGKAYLFLGKGSGWAMDTNAADADATFIGNTDSFFGGYSVACNLDTNNDGFDDILLGAQNADGAASNSGRAYVFFGKDSGWTTGVNFSAADTDYMGTALNEYAGEEVNGIGDVNNDGFDDFAIGAPNWSSQQGRTYVIFGKDSGWAKNVNLSSADASFVGEDSANESGSEISPLGDINRDGIDDFAIGAFYKDDQAGEAYLFYGNESGWGTNVNLSTAENSFVGYSGYDLGTSISTTDLNDDGLPDL